MQKTFLTLEDLECLIESLVNRILYIRGTFCKLSINTENNEIYCEINHKQRSFKNEIIPLLEIHYNKGIKKFEFNNYKNLGDGFLIYK